MKHCLIILLPGLLLLNGCATMSKEECRQADWYLKGVDDANQGYPLDRVIEHGKACAKLNIVPDMKEYRAGHTKGARLYCVPSKAYDEGRKGAAYNGICAADLEPQFLRAYRDGQELYTIQRNIDRLQNEINSNVAQIDRNYDEIVQLKRTIVYSNSEQDRRNKMYRIDDLDNEIRRLELSINGASRELDRYRHDYRVVEDKHFRMGYLQ